MTRVLPLLVVLISLFFSGCQSTPNVPLTPAFDKYATLQENCEALEITPGLLVPDKLDNSCRTFLKRLKKANSYEYKRKQFKAEHPKENVKRMPEYIALETDAHRQYRKTEVAYDQFVKDINKLSLDAIDKNDLYDVELTLSFNETKFTKEHYLYYKEVAPQHHNDSAFLSFEKSYASTLVEQGLKRLAKGDKRAALKYFKSAAELNNVEAMFLVAIVYEEKHVDKAILWHTKALEHGHTGSRINLANLYMRKTEPKLAHQFYLDAAEDGDAYAQYHLYSAFAKTSNPKAKAQADTWLEKSALNGYPLAAYAYGQHLLKAKKKSEAITWLSKAYQHGIHAASSTLGILYYKAKEYAKADHCFKDAKTAASRYYLAKMYEQGLGVDQDYYHAYILYKEAVKLGWKKVNKDVKRLSKLKTAHEQAHYEAALRKEKSRLKEQRLRFGEKPTLRNLRTPSMLIHLQGIASFPLNLSHGFILQSEEGKQYYVIDTTHQLEIKQYQYLDISAKSSANAIGITAPDGSIVKIYQLYYNAKCKY